MFKLKEFIVILCLVNFIDCSDHFGYNDSNVENRRRSYVYKKQINHHHHYPGLPKRRRGCSSRPPRFRSRYSAYDRKSDNFVHENQNSDKHNYFEDLVREVHKNYQSPKSLKSEVYVSKLPNHYTNLDKSVSYDRLVSSPEIKRSYPSFPTFQQNEMENNFYNPYRHFDQRPIRNLWKSEPLPGQIMYPPTVPRFLPIPLRTPPNYNKIDYKPTTTTARPIINQPNWIPFYLHEAVIPNKTRNYYQIPLTTPVDLSSKNSKIPKNHSSKAIKTRPEDYPQHNYGYNKILQSTDLSSPIKPVYEDVNEVNDFVVSPIPQLTSTMRTKYVLKNPLNSEFETTTPISLRVKRPEMKLVTIQRGALLMKKNDKNVLFQSRVGGSEKDENIYYVTPTPQKKIMHAKNSGFKTTSGKSLPNKIYTLGHLISHPNPAQAVESMTPKNIIPHTIYGHHKPNNQFEFYKNYSNSGKLKEINPKIITKRTNLKEKNSLRNRNDGYVDGVLDQNYDILTVKDDGFKFYDDGNEINEEKPGRSFEDVKTVDVHPNVKWILLNQRPSPTNKIEEETNNKVSSKISDFSSVATSFKTFPKVDESKTVIGVDLLVE